MTLGSEAQKLHLGYLGPKNVSSQCLEPQLQFSQTRPHFLQNSHEMNPIKSWNFEKCCELEVWGLKTILRATQAQKTYQAISRASRIKNLGTHFFVHLIICLCTHSCTSNILPLEQSFVHTQAVTCTLLYTYYNDRNILEWKINLRSISLTINPEPGLGIQAIFHRERNNRQVSCLPRTKQPDNFLATVFESNEHGWYSLVFVGLRQQ